MLFAVCIAIASECKTGWCCRLLAIMGPSGSGKTTLLNTLAHQVACQKNLDLAGEIRINGQPVESANIRQGYVQQEDMFFSQLTVRSADLSIVIHFGHLQLYFDRCSLTRLCLMTWHQLHKSRVVAASHRCLIHACKTKHIKSHRQPADLWLTHVS